MSSNQEFLLEYEVLLGISSNIIFSFLFFLSLNCFCFDTSKKEISGWRARHHKSKYEVTHVSHDITLLYWGYFSRFLLFLSFFPCFCLFFFLFFSILFLLLFSVLLWTPSRHEYCIEKCDFNILFFLGDKSSFFLFSLWTLQNRLK